VGEPIQSKSAHAYAAQSRMLDERCGKCCHDASDIPPPARLPREIRSTAPAGPDMVHSPPHYTRYKPELLDFMEGRMLQGKPITPHEYGASKYIERWRDKNGAEDLRKAANLLLRLADLVDKGYLDTERRV
jgi:hypothetical protein